MVALEPHSESEQNRSVAFSTEELLSVPESVDVRQLENALVGSSHFDPIFGPTGPLNTEDSRRPQRPA
jgi:hypothetical protein